MFHLKVGSKFMVLDTKHDQFFEACLTSIEELSPSDVLYHFHYCGFNKKFDQYLTKAEVCSRVQPIVQPTIMTLPSANESDHHISVIEEIRSRVIDVNDVRTLRRTAAFDSTTYGEVSCQALHSILSRFSIRKGASFCDLGSGTGQLTAFAALCGFGRSIGIEIRPEVHRLAQSVAEELEKEAARTGQSLGGLQIIQGSFLDPANVKMITECDVVFTNNFIFDEGLRLDMEKNIYRNMSHKSVLITTSAVCKDSPLAHYRVLKECPSTYLDVEEVVLPRGCVSWSDSPISVFIHTINWQKLPDYLATLGGEGEVDEILGQRTFDGTRQFLVKWKGYSGLFNTWIDCDDVDAKEKLKEYKLRKKNE